MQEKTVDLAGGLYERVVRIDTTDGPVEVSISGGSSGAATDANISAVGAVNHADILAMSAKLPATLGQKTAANSVSVVLSSDGPFASNFGVQADTRATWYDSVASFLSLVKLWIAVQVGAGSHVYGYTSNQLTTDAWTLFGTTRTKTFTWTGSLMTAESDWV